MTQMIADKMQEKLQKIPENNKKIIKKYLLTLTRHRFIIIRQLYDYNNRSYAFGFGILNVNGGQSQ